MNNKQNIINEGGRQPITEPQDNNNQQQEKGWLSLFSNLGSYITNMFGKIFSKEPEQSENANDTRQIELDRASKLILEKTESLIYGGAKNENLTKENIINNLKQILEQPIPEDEEEKENYYVSIIYRIIEYEILFQKSADGAAKEYLDYIEKRYYTKLDQANKFRTECEQKIDKYLDEVENRDEEFKNLSSEEKIGVINKEGKEIFQENLRVIDEKIKEYKALFEINEFTLSNCAQLVKCKKDIEEKNNQLQNDIRYLERLKELYEKWDINNENGLRIFRGSEDEKIEWHELTKDYQVSETDYMKINGETSEYNINTEL